MQISLQTTRHDSYLSTFLNGNKWFTYAKNQSNMGNTVIVSIFVTCKTFTLLSLWYLT